MTMNFASPGAFGSFLAKTTLAMPMAYSAALNAAADIVLERARSEPGEYQRGAGPFPSWQPLAQSTLDDKARGGWPSPSPLLRTGEMAASYEKSVGATVAYVGSNDDKAVWQEFGTSKIPPRSVIGIAGARSESEIHALTGRIFYGLLTTGVVKIPVGGKIGKG